jgi:hypothetical protein
MSATWVESVKENKPLEEEKKSYGRLSISKTAIEAAEKVRRRDFRRLVEIGDH